MSDIPMAQDFAFIRYRHVWVSENDIQFVLERIREIGEFDSEGPDPERNHLSVEYYLLKDDSEAEVFWDDDDKQELGGIRLSLVYDENEESEYNSRMGFFQRSGSEGAVADSHSDTLSPYMRYVFEKALDLTDR